MFLMKNLKHLEVLDISHNLQVETVWHGNIRFVIYVDPDNEINQNGSRIDKFVNCQRLVRACKLPLADGEIMQLVGV